MSLPEDEALVQMAPGAGWPRKVRWNFERLARIRPTRNAAVVTTMRDEGISILEWIAHHRVLGFDGIFIYTNDNRDGSDPLLARLAEAGIITWIENRMAGTVSPQAKAFEHSLHLLPELREYEWVLYADADEFLVLDECYDNEIANVTADVAARFPRQPPSAICYHWKWMVSGRVYARTPGMLLNRFQHSYPNMLFKSLVRLPDAISMRNVHYPELRMPGFYVDSGLRPIEEMSKFGDILPSYEGGHLRHYWFKSFQEFAIKKYRGDTLNISNNVFEREFQLFFDWNGVEMEANFDPPPASLVAAVEAELAALRARPGIKEAEACIDRDFLQLLAPYGGDAGLRALYDKMMAAHGS